MKGKVLITGGVGYLGGHLTNVLKEDFIVYDNLLYEQEYLKSIPFVYGDVRDHKKLKEYLNKVDAVIWLAGIVGDAACSLRATMAKETNELAVKFLAENFKGRIIYTSTASIYGINDKVATEESAPNPLSLYAETKLKGEKYLEKKNALILRLGTLHGVAERQRFDIVVNILTLRALLRKKIEIFGGNQWRPLVHVKDVAEFINQVLWDEHTGIYNVSSENLKIIDIARMIKEEIPDLQIKITESKYEDKRSYRISTEKAKHKLNFKPKVCTRDSIKAIKKLIKSGRIKDYSNIKYSNLSKLSVGE